MNEYYKNLPRKRMASGALFFESQKMDKVLIVKPTYKNYWEIPGGVVEAEESPLQACIRECEEELGIVLGTGIKLSSVDYVSDTDGKGDRIMYIFNGGVLDEASVKKIILQEKELSEFCFVDVSEAEKLLGDRLKKRVPNTMEAIRNGQCVYMEGGEVVG